MKTFIERLPKQVTHDCYITTNVDLKLNNHEIEFYSLRIYLFKRIIPS